MCERITFWRDQFERQLQCDEVHQLLRVPTVIQLQELAASMLGKEAGLFVTSGTMGNLASILAHCTRGDEIILGNTAHTFLFEAGGIAALGGVTSYTDWGPYYEEYTSSIPTLVLNGFIFSLCGVYDFIRVYPDNDLAKQIFKDGIQTLKTILPEYNLGFWSRYNLCQADWYPAIDPATIGYQRLHATQLTMLYSLTGESVFLEYAQPKTAP